MPLIRSASKKAFSENVRREMHAGKPQKQAVAIAYSVKRKAQSGGRVSAKRVKHLMSQTCLGRHCSK